MLRLRNSLFTLLRAASTLPSPIHRRLLSTAITPAPFSLEDYLVASCGLAPAQAREVCNKLSRELLYRRSPRLNSASNPDAILALLTGAGLSRDDIAAVVSVDPLILRASVKNVAPRLLALRDRLGLSTPDVTRFLVVGSHALREGDVCPRLQFYGSFDRVLVAAKRCMTLLTAGLESLIKPNIALLHQWGVRDIAKLCTDNAWLLTFSPERVKEFLRRAQELGVPPTSRMFRHAVATVSCNSSDKVAAKLEFYKRTLGVSESEVSTAVSKMPAILGIYDQLLLRKIKLNEAGMEPQYIIQRPVLLSLSLEKRLVPRHYVMKILQQNGLLNRNTSLFTLSTLGEEAFNSKFVDCHKDSDPGLADAYAGARAGIVPSSL